MISVRVPLPSGPDSSLHRRFSLLESLRASRSRLARSASRHQCGRLFLIAKYLFGEQRRDCNLWHESAACYGPYRRRAWHQKFLLVNARRDETGEPNMLVKPKIKPLFFIVL